MKYSIPREQQFFFEQNGYIEFDGLLSPAEQKKLIDACKPGLSRNFSHRSDAIKAITHSRRLAALASQLTHTKLLRFGFDQLFTEKIYTDLCINGLICLLFIEIDSPEGHAFFAKFPVNTETLPLKPNERYFVIGWADEKAQYMLEPKDPHTHELKKLGYVFGDRLQEKWHPTLIR